MLGLKALSGEKWLRSALAQVSGRTPTAFLARIRRALLLPLILAAVPLFWVIDATQRASLTTLGRDQGIFQYIAWAVLRGDVDLTDRDAEGFDNS